MLRPMAAGPITVALVPASGHFLPEENPAFVTAQLRGLIDADAG